MKRFAPAMLALLTGFGLAPFAHAQDAADTAPAGVGSTRVGTYEAPANYYLGARLGVVSIESTSSPALSLGLNADFPVNQNFMLGGVLDYWTNTSKNIGATKVGYSDVVLGPDAKFVFTSTSSTLRPYVLAGAMLHRLVTTTEQPVAVAAITSTKTDYKLGVDLGTGLSYDLAQRLGVNGEIRYRNVLDRVLNVDQLAFQAGVSYAM